MIEGLLIVIVEVLMLDFFYYIGYLVDLYLSFVVYKIISCVMWYIFLYVFDLFIVVNVWVCSRI